MNTFQLQIVTPKGLMAEEEAQSLTVRTTAGDVGILAGHADYVAPVAKGLAKITDKNGKVRTAECNGGLVSVKNGTVRLVADEFEWNEGH